MPNIIALLETARDWAAGGSPAAVAVSIAAEGRLPFPLGSMLIADGNGRFRGTLSGGCIEAEIIVRAQKALDSGASQTVILPIGSAAFRGPDFKEPDGCASSLTVLIAPAAPFIAVLPLLYGKSGIYLATDHAAASVSVRAVSEPLKAGEIQIPVPPLRRLRIVGATDIAAALAAMAHCAGFQCEIIDPRSIMQCALSPGVARIDDWPDDAFRDDPPDAGTAVVVLAHDSKLDDAALGIALESPAFYIAALGSRATHGRRLERLAARGWDAAALARIQGPAGLNIGAQTPEEIAASILAALIAAWRLGAPSARPWT